MKSFNSEISKYLIWTFSQMSQMKQIIRNERPPEKLWLVLVFVGINQIRYYFAWINFPNYFMSNPVKANQMEVVHITSNV